MQNYPKQGHLPYFSIPNDNSFTANISQANLGIAHLGLERYLLAPNMSFVNALNSPNQLVYANFAICYEPELIYALIQFTYQLPTIQFLKLLYPSWKRQRRNQRMLR
jgi:hypothetical protein